MKLIHSQTFATDSGLFVGWFFEVDGGIQLKLEDAEGTYHDGGEWPDAHAAADSVRGFAPAGSKDPLWRWRDPKYQLKLGNQRGALGLSKEWSILAAHAKGYADTGVRCASEAEARAMIQGVAR